MHPGDEEITEPILAVLASMTLRQPDICTQCVEVGALFCSANHCIYWIRKQQQQTLAGFAFIYAHSITLNTHTVTQSHTQSGVVDWAIECLTDMADRPLVCRQACILMRNMVVRNPEIRPIYLEKGEERALIDWSCLLLLI